MAKSLRSKWRRKMRSVKRERYGEKEMKRLNDMLMKAGDIQFVPEIKEEKEEEEGAIDMEHDVDQAEPRSTRRSRKDKMEAKKAPASATTAVVAEEVDLTKGSDDKMVVDGERIFRQKTMRDQYGNYPVWMNKRKIRTQQRKNKRLKKRAKSLKRK